MLSALHTYSLSTSVLLDDKSDNKTDEIISFAHNSFVVSFRMRHCFASFKAAKSNISQFGVGLSCGCR